MKRKEKIRWLREVAKWLRAAAGAPSILLVIVWLGNGALLLMGRTPSLQADPDPAKIGAPGILVAGAAYIGFSAVATKLELMADALEEDDRPSIVIETSRSRRNSGRDSS